LFTAAPAPTWAEVAAALLLLLLQRATKIEVQYQDLDGKAQQMQLRDFVARVFQHEYDHLQVSWKLYSCFGFVESIYRLDVQFTATQQQQQQMQLRDFVARVFQHEYDHPQVSWKFQVY
jgi:peptide deformylase